MRACDFDRLSAINVTDAESGDVELATALGVKISPAQDLHDRMRVDFSDAAVGISWWETHLDTDKRRAISDYVYNCTREMGQNLIGSALHLLELKDCWETTQNKMARAIKKDREIRHPEVHCAADLLNMKFEGLHLSGYFQHVVAALDCFASVAIGVLAVPTPVFRADFTNFLNWLKSEKNKNIRERHLAFREKLLQEIAASGPSGWFDWIYEYRNMFSHRAHRLRPYSATPEAHLVDHNNDPILYTKVTPLLISEPGLSELQAFLEKDWVIPQHAAEVLEEILRSVTCVLSAMTAHLCTIWDERKNDPRALMQPTEQWPDALATKRTGFKGYSTNPNLAQYDALSTGPDVIRRIRAAQLGRQKPNKP